MANNGPVKPDPKKLPDTRKGDKPFPAHGESAKNRKSELTMELIENLCGIAQLGTSQKSAAYANSISPATLNYWITQGRKNPDSIHGVLFERLQKAIANKEVHVLNNMSFFLHGRPSRWEKVMKKKTVIKANGDKEIFEEEQLVCVEEEIIPDPKSIQWFLRNRFADNWGDIIGLNQNKEEFMGGVDLAANASPTTLKEAKEEVLNIAAQIGKITGTMDDE
jgi:hypothetical protein